MTFKKCGHEKTPENTKPGERCRTCARRNDVKYRQTSKRRAAEVKYERTNGLAAHRRLKYGASPEDVAALLDAQRDAQGVARCPLCGGEVNERDALDHAHGLHGQESHRGIAHRTHCNPAFGRTDQDLSDRARNLSKYAGRRRKKLIKNECKKARTNTWATR